MAQFCHLILVRANDDPNVQNYLEYLSCQQSWTISHGRGYGAFDVRGDSAGAGRGVSFFGARFIARSRVFMPFWHMLLWPESRAALKASSVLDVNFSRQSHFHA